jgi:D-amino-acid dehydrogenase
VKRAIHVIGAGMVGLCCGIELARRGFAVTLIDRGAPARETSFGNAGVLAHGSIMPESSPAVWGRLGEFLANRGADVHIHYRQLPRMVGYLRRFLVGANKRAYERNAAALNALLNRAVDAHAALASEANAGSLIRNRGWIKLYRTAKGLAKSAEDERLLVDNGIEFERLDPNALADLEPALSRVFAGGRWMTGAAAVSNPGALGDAYASLFRSLGGRIAKEDVRRLEASQSGWKIVCDSRTVEAESVVVAAGAWSGQLLRSVGYSFPLIAERGYHQHFDTVGGVSLNRPIHDIEGGYVLAPMDMGHRLTTGVEWAPLGAPPTPVQLARVIPRAKEAFPLGEPNSKIWLGNRPQTPDTLPVIGQIPGCPGLWLATGHGHLGLSLGPVTGILIAKSITEESVDIDLSHYSPARFKPRRSTH